MKKLLIAMMSVASLAFISKADAINSGTTFEGYNSPDGKFDANRDDRGGNDGTFWYTAGSSTDCATLTNTDYTATYTDERPAIAQGAATATALAVEAEQRLERGIVGYSDGFAPQDIGSGIYFDTMVQFTATDTAPTPSQDDKLIVWLYGSAEEDGAFGIGTNLVVTAGYIADSENTVNTSNYVVTAAASVEPNSWHRLTIKAIENIGTASTAPAGFVVFIDGVAVTSTDAKGAEGSAIDALNPTAAKWANMNALFPCRIKGNAINARALASVGLEGTGMIDDISFTSTAPSFASDNAYLALTWDENVTALAYAVGTSESVSVDITKGECVIDLGGSAGGYEVTLYPTYASGYGAGEWTADPETALDGTKVTVGAGASVSVGVVSYRAICKIGDVEYGSLAEAFEAVTSGSATIVLMGNVSDKAYGAVAEEVEITLDLAGHTLVGGNAPDGEGVMGSVIDNFGGKLTIIDSSEEKSGRIVTVDDDYYTIWCDEGSSLYVEAGIFDGAISCEDTTETVISGGKFAGDDGSFYLNAYLDEDCSAEYSEGYWTIVEGEGPTPPPATKWTVTVAETLPEHVLSVTATPNEVSSDAASKTVTLSATFDEGYELDHFVVDGAAIEGNTFTISASVVVSAVAKQTIVPVTSVTLDKETAELTVGGTLELTATVNPENATDKTVTWTSSDTEKATVVDGLVVAVAAGEVTITATAGEKTASCVVTVKAVTPEKTYPNYIPADASDEVKAKFDAWAAAYGTRDDESANEAAYLLNVAPADAETEAAKFAITAITVGDGVVVTVPSQNSAGKAFNGTVEIKGKAALTDADWATVDYTTHHFFKAFLK